MNKEFSTTKVTPEGVQKINRSREVFDVALEELKILCPEGRELSLVKTKLEEASFFAVKAISYANVGAEDSYKAA
jgi:hypothetical protein